MPERDQAALLACGCDDPTDHVTPHTDPDLGIEHGERDAMNGDPLPHDVPGSGGWNGLYSASPDKFCLCGHPNYLTCNAWPSGGIAGLVITQGASDV